MLNSLSRVCKIRQKHLFAFYVGGEEGVVYLSSFCFIIPPFYHRVVKSNSKYDEEMKMKKSRNEKKVIKNNKTVFISQCERKC